MGFFSFLHYNFPLLIHEDFCKFSECCYLEIVWKWFASTFGEKSVRGEEEKTKTIFSSRD